MRIVPAIRAAFAVVGVIATVLGLIEGMGYLKDQWDKRRAEQISSIPLISSTRTVQLESGQHLERTITAGTIYVAAGNLVVPEGSVWIANHVVLRAGAVLRDHKISIVASSIEGGAIDVSGESGVGAGNAGADGGEILLAAGHVINVRLLARGGDGAQGIQGQAGANGRDGKCDGFGGYRGADGGGDGKKGGTGGHGGSGGVIRVAYFASSSGCWLRAGARWGGRARGDGRTRWCRMCGAWRQSDRTAGRT